MEHNAKETGCDARDGAVLEGPVTLEIVGGDGEIVNCHEGQCYYKNGHHYILFAEELAEDGKKGNVTYSSRLKISEKEVRLRRSLPGMNGSPRAHVMEFIYLLREEGERGCLVDYPTPYGTLSLEILTKELTVERREAELLAKIRYVMLQEGQEINQGSLKISIRRA